MQRRRLILYSTLSQFPNPGKNEVRKDGHTLFPVPGSSSRRQAILPLPPAPILETLLDYCDTFRSIISIPYLG